MAQSLPSRATKPGEKKREAHLEVAVLVAQLFGFEQRAGQGQRRRQHRLAVADPRHDLIALDLHIRPEEPLSLCQRAPLLKKKTKRF